MTNPKIDNYGNQYWYNRDGQIHRTDGPAFIRANGRAYWRLNNQMYFDNKSFQQASNLSDEDMTVIVLKYGNVK